jgi:hypothetical protein
VSDDVKLNAKARKLVIANRLDIARIRVRVTRGVIHFQGRVHRLGEDPRAPESNEPFLEKLDEQVRQLQGFRGVHFAFDNWRREPTGTWRFTGKRAKGGRK